MIHETRGAKFVRGLVKFVFIACYVAFMWASIHKVAFFFGNFEEDGNTLGSYGLAGAFDITALVTTIGVMFFRRSMPRRIQVLVWAFIVAIAAFSYFVNWEYDAHFQATTLTLQATGDTTPVYDGHGVLHYAPVMRQNLTLLFVNPLLASGFTIFSLIYSIVAEFFGTKQPTVEELQARKQYLEETAGVLESIRQLEEQGKGKSLLMRTKRTVEEGKAVWKELKKPKGNLNETERHPERHPDEAETIVRGETPQESGRHLADISEEPERKPGRNPEGTAEESAKALTEENLPSWLVSGGSTVPLSLITENLNISTRLLRNRVEKREIRATKNKDIVYKDSLIAWMKKAGYLQETEKIVSLHAMRTREETRQETAPQQAEKPEDKLTKTLDTLKGNPDITDEDLADILGLTRPASARFWRVKARELLAQERGEQETESLERVAARP